VRQVVSPRLAPVVGAVVALLLLSPTAVPHTLAGPVRQAEEAFARGRSEAALEALEAALAFEPGYAALHPLAAQAALEAALPERAVDHLRAAEAMLTPDPIRICQQGLALAMLGDVQGAADSWETGAAACYDQPDIVRMIAEQALASGDRETALDSLERLTVLEPANPTTHLHLGLALATRDPEAAVGSLRLADELTDGGSAAAREMMRVIQQASREDDLAFTLASVGQSLGEMGEWRLAAWAFREAITLYPPYVEARAYYGLALDQSGSDGLAQLQSAAEFSPQNPLPRFFLGVHWRARGEPQAAVVELLVAAELDPANPSIAAELGGAYEDLGEMTSALAAFQYATDLAPRQAGFWRLLAEFSLRNGIQVREIGIPAARNAYSLAPADPVACDNLAYGHYLAGEFALAERLIHRALELDAARPATQYHLGLLLLELHQGAAAQAALETAAQLDPEGAIGELAERTLEGLSHP